MTTTSKRTPRLPAAERRRQLLDAALDLSCEGGFRALTVEAIARRAGVTRPVIYDIFGDLDGLLVALIDREEANAMAPLAEIVPSDPGDRDPDEMLVTGIEAYLSAVRDAPATWRLVLLAPQGSPPALRQRIRDNRKQVTDRLEALVDWGVGVRGAPRGLDHSVLAHLLVAAAEDAARLVLAHPRRYSPQRMAGAAHGLVALLPRGGVPDAGAGAPPRAHPHAAAAIAAVPPANTQPLPAATARLPLAQRRRQLLDVTLELLAGEGFDALSMEAIARRAGVDRVVVYRSFANLQLLLVALLRREQKRTERQLDAIVPAAPGDRDPSDVLRDALVGFLEAVGANPLTWRLALVAPESAPAALRTIVDRRRAALERRIRRLVAWGVSALDVGPDELDVEVMSRMLLSFGEELGRLQLDGFPQQRLVASTEALLATVPWRATPTI